MYFVKFLFRSDWTLAASGWAETSHLTLLVSYNMVPKNAFKRLILPDRQRASYNSEPHPLQNLSPSSIGSPQLPQNLAGDCFSTRKSKGLRMSGEGRRETICQIKATRMMRPPVTAAAKAQLMPEPVFGVAGNVGVCMLVFGGGKLVADN